MKWGVGADVPKWRLDKANYEMSFVPDFNGHPSRMNDDGCLEGLIDKQLANKTMNSCDQTMKLLAGPRISLGTLKGE